MRLGLANTVDQTFSIPRFEPTFASATFFLTSQTPLEELPLKMNLLLALMAALVSLSAHVSAQNFQHSCYSESSHCLIPRRHRVSQGTSGDTEEEKQN